MPLPEKALISGKRACKAGSKLEASNTSNCSICPSAFGREITVECLEALPTTVNNSCFNGLIFTLNNLKAAGNETLATALSVVILPASVCEDQKFLSCAITVLKNVNDKKISNSFLINDLVFKFFERINIERFFYTKTNSGKLF